MAQSSGTLPDHSEELQALHQRIRSIEGEVKRAKSIVGEQERCTCLETAKEIISSELRLIRAHARALSSAVTRVPSSPQVYVLELFSGSGKVSRVARDVLCNVWGLNSDEICVETVDASVWLSLPSIPAGLPDDAAEVIQLLKDRYPTARPIIWASPDCTFYSKARTCGGPRDLESADALVTVTKDFGRELNALAMVIENPGTGLLGERECISFMPFKYDVDYCKYGGLIRKRTSLWASLDLGKGGIEPAVCKYDCHATCVAWNGVKRHVRQLSDIPTEARVLVPEQLAASVFIAIAKLLRPDMSSRDPQSSTNMPKET